MPSIPALPARNSPPVPTSEEPLHRCRRARRRAQGGLVGPTPRLGGGGRTTKPVDPQVREFIDALTASDFKPVHEQTPAEARDECEGVVKALGIARDSHAPAFTRKESGSP